MTTATLAPARRGRYEFADVARMEWIKLRSLRSTWWTLGVSLAGAVGLALAVGLKTRNVDGDLTNNLLSGIAPGMLVVGVLGALMATSEFSSGLIKASLVAVPDRRRLLAAKAAVFGAVALAVGEATSLLSFLVGAAALRTRMATPSLGDPVVLRAVLLSGLGTALVGLVGMGIGAIVRGTPAAIGVVVGGVYVLGTVIAGILPAVGAYIPVEVVGNSLAATRPFEHALSPWAGLGVLCVETAVLLAAGGRLLARRDA